MVVPIYDDNPLRHIRHAYVNWGLIGVTVLAHGLIGSGALFGPDGAQRANLALGVIPAVFNDLADLPPQLNLVPEILTPFTYMFLHADWFHLLGNMLFLWVFGDNIEDVLGSVRYFFFYIACGVCAALTFAWLGPHAAEAPLIGASGAVAGVIAAYFLLFPHARVWVLLFWRLPIRVEAWVALGIWIVIQIWQVFAGSQADGVAWLAHIGGLSAGAILILAFRRTLYI